MSALRMLVVALSVTVTVAGVHADLIEITTDTFISDTDLSLDGHDIVVRGATLTINGAHEFASLTLLRNASNVPGVVTHSLAFTNRSVNGLFLIVTGDVLVEGPDRTLVGSRIDLGGRGFGATQGPGGGTSAVLAGGGGHGGIGGAPTSGLPLGGGAYGSIAEPIELGSGGGNDANVGGTTGGRGGGAVRLVVGGTLTLDGQIVAHGLAGTVEAGGGSGGSIWIDCGTLTGNGAIGADGGDGGGGATVSGGGGAGGRVSIAAGTSAISSASIHARGGLSGTDPLRARGAAGTVWLDDQAATRPALIIDNGGVLGEWTALSGAQAFDADLVVRSAGRFGPAIGDDTFAVSFTGDALVDATSEISATGRGFAGATGPGAGASSTRGGGGGHGGIGGPSDNDVAGGPVYGSVTEPTEMGSGGGNDVNVGGTTGARGGGALRLIVDGTLTLDGLIVAHGLTATTAEAGGGAGGSIWIDCGTLTGSGTVGADGGAGAGGVTAFGGGGAGGRVSIVAGTSTIADTNFHARGGLSGTDPLQLRGGAGTVWLDDQGAARPVLIVDNGGVLGEWTALSGTHAFDADLIVRSAGRFGPAIEDDSFAVSFTGDAIVDATSEITATGRGFAGATGPGAGANSTRGGGGGHGGIGGPSDNGVAGGPVYGSVTEPTEMGSGGGNDTNIGGTTGARGGGALRLVIGGTLTLDGLIVAHGSTATALEAGGGAGGSIWIDCGTLTGSGTIGADGGAGAGGVAAFGGGGAGGRVSIVAGTSTIADTNFHARGGLSGTDPLRLRGGAGTVWFDDASAARPVLIVDNGGVFGEWTALSGTYSFDADLIVRSAGRFGPAIGDDSFAVSFTGDALVDAASEISATGRGFAGATGPGAGANSTRGGGGGHGGIGGPSDDGVAGGAVYGSVTEPAEMGSGGGNDTNIGGTTGGRGGGVVRLTVGGTLVVDGTVVANGAPGVQLQAGGGAGGSLRIECGTLSGAGTIAANGGDGAGSEISFGGGGAGGRVAIVTGASSFPSTGIQAHGGAGGLNSAALSGGAGTVWLADSSATRPILIIDNGDSIGEWTAFTGASVFDADLLVRRAGRLGPSTGDATMDLTFAGDATIEPDGQITASGRGLAAGAGSGAGASSALASGAGHGGVGGAASSGLAGGASYGSVFAPTEPGSGGGNDTNTGVTTGGRGGGVIRLTVTGIITVNGTIEADGGDGTALQAGGGSGGSVWLTAGGIFGGGMITADGGAGAGNASGYGGGGGGGRIAIYSCAVDLPTENIRAAGGQSGLSANTGSDGTVGYFSDTVDFVEPPQSVAAVAGTTVQFTTVATGDGVTGLQWYYDGLPLVDGPGVTGAQTDSLTIFDAQCGVNTGAYRVAVFDACGFAFSPDAFLIVPILGDVNGDCVVNGADLGALLNVWGACPGCPADLNGDGTVDGADLGILLNQWD